jgi:flagellar hook-associated protein 2
MGSTVDGLISGMDTTAMIQSMMSIEAAPQTLLKNKVSTAQTAVSSYQSVNSKLAALKGAADDLGQLSTWRSIKPTISSSSVTATALGGVSTGTGVVTFDVISLAKAQASSARVASTGDITSADSIQVSIGGADPVSIDISKDKTAAGVVLAINNAGIAVKGSIVQTSTGDSMMTLSGTKTGVGNTFTIAGMEDVSSLHTVTEASNAEIKVGGATDDVDDDFSLTSDTNTFTGLMPGVALTVSKVETGVTLSSVSDVSGIAAKFQALVDAANKTLTEIGNQTAYDSSTNAGSPLTGDFTVRQMSQSILSAVSRGLSYTNTSTDVPPVSTAVNFGSLSKLGIQLDKTGKLTFDADKFTATYNADPTSIKTAGIALADQFETLAGKQSDTLAATITSSGTQIDSLNLQIDNWDVRLASRQSALSRQYANLETSLGKLKDQSTWLSGQIAGLS